MALTDTADKFTCRGYCTRWWYWQMGSHQCQVAFFGQLTTSYTDKICFCMTGLIYTEYGGITCDIWHFDNNRSWHVYSNDDTNLQSHLFSSFNWRCNMRQCVLLLLQGPYQASPKRFATRWTICLTKTRFFAGHYRIPISYFKEVKLKRNPSIMKI